MPVRVAVESERPGQRDGPALGAGKLHPANPVDFLLGGELLADIETGKRIAIVRFVGGVLAEPAYVEFQHRSATFGEREASRILEHLVAQTARKPGDDHRAGLGWSRRAFTRPTAECSRRANCVARLAAR